ncbi:MAG: replication-associated recombination protein A, partial [Gemmatimonadetes bacterium]|nr:replication-associated recombination protein A [Gemmatimonadota bacterium]
PGRDSLFEADPPGGVSRQQYLPAGRAGEEYYRPGDAGWEGELGRRLAEWRRKRR